MKEANEFGIPCDLAYFSLSSAVAQFQKEYGYSPSTIRVSARDEEVAKLLVSPNPFIGMTVTVDPDIPEDAWEVTDQAGVEGYGSKGV